MGSIRNNNDFSPDVGKMSWTACQFRNIDGWWPLSELGVLSSQSDYMAFQNPIPCQKLHHGISNKLQVGRKQKRSPCSQSRLQENDELLILMFRLGTDEYKSCRLQSPSDNNIKPLHTIDGDQLTILGSVILEWFRVNKKSGSSQMLCQSDSSQMLCSVKDALKFQSIDM